jgi:GTPase
MKFRLKEGSGEANYFIGYEDNGFNLGINETDFKSTLAILCYMVRELNIEMVVE